MFECKRHCPNCGDQIIHKNKRECIAKYLCKLGIRNNSKCRKCAATGQSHSEETKRKLSRLHSGHSFFEGKSHSSMTKIKLSTIRIGKRHDNETRRKMSIAIKNAMHRPDVRKKHIEALSDSKWLKVKTDKGQLELLEKWNRLGFNFQPNYQVHSDGFLAYVDGYDPIHNIVLEYDSKYHQRASQKQKDLSRQNKIIDIVNPKKFWRYNGITKTFSQII